MNEESFHTGNALDECTSQVSLLLELLEVLDKIVDVCRRIGFALGIVFGHSCVRLGLFKSCPEAIKYTNRPLAIIC